MMIKRIAHVAYLVNDMKKTLAFYEQAFGFKPKFTLEDDQGKPWIVYVEVAKEQFIELFYTNDKVAFQPHQTYNHLCFEVIHLKEFVASLKEKGIKIKHDVILGKDNNYQAWIDDPDGNPIELMEYGKDALQLK